MHDQEDNLSSLSDALKEFIRSNRLEKGFNKMSVRDAWHRLMGPAISKYTKTVELNNDILYVTLESAPLREELSYGKEKIVNLLNEEMGKTLIRKIVLR